MIVRVHLLYPCTVRPVQRSLIVSREMDICKGRERNVFENEIESAIQLNPMDLSVIFRDFGVVCSEEGIVKYIPMSKCFDDFVIHLFVFFFLDELEIFEGERLYDAIWEFCAFFVF